MERQRVAVLLIVIAAGTIVPVPASGQDTDWAVPRTADGQPDLQGIWANNSATPMERPEQLAGKAVLSDEELAELTQRVNQFRDSEQAGDLLGDRLIQQALGNSEFNDFDVITGNYNAFWLVERSLDNRTSLIVDPPNGRILALTAVGRSVRASARRAYSRECLSRTSSVRRSVDASRPPRVTANRLIGDPMPPSWRCRAQVDRRSARRGAYFRVIIRPTVPRTGIWATDASTLPRRDQALATTATFRSCRHPITWPFSRRWGTFLV